MSRSLALLFASLACFAVSCGNTFKGPSEDGGSGGEDAIAGAGPRAGAGNDAGAPSTGDAGAGDGPSIGDAGAGGEPAGEAGTSQGGSAGTTPRGGAGGLLNVGGTIGIGGALGGIAGAPPVFTSSKLLDDMEDGNSTLLDTNGDWYVFTDSSGGTIQPLYGTPFTMTALAPVRQASTKAARVTVSNFTGWGAAFGFDFSYKNQLRQVYDLGDHRGVRFWVKADKATEITYQVPDATTDSVGGQCTTGTSGCGAHWSQVFAVTTQWARVSLLFSNLKQQGSGLKALSFDAHHVYSMFFVLAPKQAITVWVDDVELVK